MEKGKQGVKQLWEVLMEQITSELDFETCQSQGQGCLSDTGDCLFRVVEAGQQAR